MDSCAQLGKGHGSSGAFLAINAMKQGNQGLERARRERGAARKRCFPYRSADILVRSNVQRAEGFHWRAGRPRCLLEPAFWLSVAADRNVRAPGPFLLIP